MVQSIALRRILVIWFCILTGGLVSAQNNPQLTAVAHVTEYENEIQPRATPLKETLAELEKKFHVGFLYYSGVGDETYLRNTPRVSDDLELTLVSILNPLNLISVQVGASSYVIAHSSEKKAVLEAFGSAPPQETGSVAGKITDAAGEPLSGTQVVLVGTNFGDVADVDGNFQIKDVPPGSYSLRASFIGYRSQSVELRVNAGETTTQNFTLALDILNMETVVTTATRTGRVQKEATTSMAVLAARRLEQFQPQSVAEVLRTVPGIHAEEGGGEVAVNSFVRGLPAPGQFRYQTLQEDGIPVRSIPGGFISAEDVFFRYDLNVRTLEVAKGGSSTLFGINAPGGIINYISKTGGQVINSTLRFTGGEKNFYRADFNTNGPLGGNYYFNLGGFYRFDEGPRISGLPTQGLQIKGNVTRLMENGHLRLHFKYLDDRVQFLLPFAHRRETQKPAIDSDGTQNSAEAADFTIPTPNGIFESTMERGVMTKGGSIMFEYYNEWSDGWSLENKTRWMDMQHEFNIFIPTVPAFPEAFAGRFKKDPADQAIYSFTNHPAASFNAEAVVEQGLWARFRPTEELANQFIVQKRLQAGNAQHAFSFGAYLSRTEATDNQIRTFGLFELADQPRLVDLQIQHTDGSTTQVTRNGITQVSNNFFNRRFGSNTVAIFGGDELKIGDRWRIDIGARWERQTATVRVEKTQNFDLRTPSDSSLALTRAVFGSGEFVRRNLAFDDFGVAVGINFAVTDYLNVYGTGSRGFVFPELSTFAGNVSLDAQGNFVQPDPKDNEEFLQAEAGVRLASSQWSGTLSGFWVRINDRLQDDIRIIDGKSVQITDAVGTSRTFGLEATGAFAPRAVPGLRLESSLTLQDHEATDFKIGNNDFSGKDIKRIPQFMLNSSLFYQLHGIDFMLNWLVLGDRFADDANLQKLDEFGVVTLDAGYTVPFPGGQNVRFGINVYNLFDSEGLTEGDPRLPAGVDPANFPFFNARPVLPLRVKFSATYNF